MKAIAERIYKELNKKKIDWLSLEQYIASLGESINTYDENMEETILSEAYISHRKVGSVNVRLTELFLKHGFDVKANEGKNGASCLEALCWSSYDQYVLHVAERLLDIGADSTIGEEDDPDNPGVLSSISWKEGYWHTGEYDAANMFMAYYEMVWRQQQGKQYKGIRAFRDAVGETLYKVEKMKVHGYKNAERNSYLMYCGDKHLVIEDYVELSINPYVREEAIEVEDVSEEFNCLIGAKVRGLRYLNNSLAKLNFDNGHAVLIRYNDSSGVNETKAWLRIISSKSSRLPAEGTVIKYVKLWGEIGHSDESTFYREDTIVLGIGDSVYGLYSHGYRYGVGTVRAEQLDTEMTEGLERSIDVHNLALKHIEYVGDAMKWINFSCDEGILYVVCDKFQGVSMFMSEYEIDAEYVMDIDWYTTGLKKINFIGKEKG